MEKDWIWFNILKISAKTKLNILKRYKIQDIYNKRDEIVLKFNLLNNEMSEFNNSRYKLIANKVIEYNKKNCIGVLNILDNRYPCLLKNTYDPPIILYYKGNLNVLDNKLVSIFIGKNIDTYGKKVLNGLTEELYSSKINMVTKFEEYNKNVFMRNVKHENVLVVSSGIKNSFYTNKGIILSEYEPYINSSRMNNIMRNRIITGITKESVLIQTTLEDGAGYIVDNVLQHNRELWVIPGDITKTVNFFTNELIKQGVNVLTQYNNLWVYEQNIFQKNMLTANNCHRIVTKQ